MGKVNNISFSELYENSQAKHANNIAIADCRCEITYSQLDRISGNIARYLRGRNVKAGSIVGIHADRSIEFIAASLAVFRLGAAYVSIDSSYPQSRVNYVVEDCGISTVLKSPELSEIAFNEAEVFDINIDELDRDYESFTSFEKPNSLAYLIYTSGSTGVPKAAMVRYENFLNMICWQSKYYSINSGDRTSWIARPGFDATLFELWAYIISGSSIHIPEQELLYEPLKLIEWLRANEITISFMPTPLAESCLEAKWPTDTGLRYLFSGGDALRKRPPKNANFKMYDHYGPSECAIVTSFAEISPCGDEEKNLLPNIGYAIDNVSMHIMSDNTTEADKGEIGEICICGAGVGSGYLNNKELTEEKFIADPFSKDKNAKMYKSGDLGLLLEDGSVEFHGRVDRQVKIRGHRIELGEIENLLLGQRDVKNAAVVASEGGSTQKKIIAYLVPKSKGGEEFVSSVKEYLGSQIAAYMMPAQFVELDELPVSINGKIDRLSLAKSTGSGEVLTTRKLPLKTVDPVEKQLVEIFYEVLGRNINIGPDDNFFDLGGDSLKAGMVVSRVRNEFNIDYSVRSFFENPTAASSAPVIKSADKKPQELPEILPAEQDGEIPVTPAQMHILMLNDMQDDNSVCNIAAVMDIDGFVDHNTFQQAIDMLLERQQLLKGSFAVSREGYRIDIADDARCELAYEDIIRVRAENKAERIEKIVRDYSHTNFDVTNGPLCKFALIRVEDMHFKLVSVFHHAIADGWSMCIFVMDILALYESAAKGTVLKLAQPEVQYTDYAFWLEEWLGTSGAAGQLEYWRNQLSDAELSLDLSCAKSRPEGYTFAGARKYFSIPAEMTSKMEELCRKHDSTMYMILLSVYAIVLRYFSGSDRFVIGSPIANRPLAEVEKLVGLFMNAVSLKFEFAPVKTFEQLLSYVKDIAFEAFANQNIPFEMVVENLAIENDRSRHPVFQHLFIYQNAHISKAEISGLKILFDEVGNDTAKLDLTLNVFKREGCLEGHFEYNTDLFSAECIEQICGKFVEVLNIVIDEVETDIDSFGFYEEPQEQEVAKSDDEPIGEADETLPEPEAEEIEKPETFGDMFANAAGLYPDNIAVCDEKVSLTYSQLDKISLMLANDIGSDGAGLVGVAADNSVNFVVSALAVMRSGRGYVPISLYNPPERNSYIIANTGISVLLKPAGADIELQSSAVRIYNVDTEALLNCTSESAAAKSAAMEDTAYVIYTSGSTGTPKGVEISHANLANLIQWQCKYYSISNEDKASQLASTSFDTSVSEIWPFLAAGASVNIAPRETATDPLELVKWLAEKEITVSDVTTPVAEILLESQWPDEIKLRVLKTGGATLHKRPRAELPFDFYNEYGPTECTVITTAGLIDPADNGLKYPHIGKAIDGVNVYILDEKFQAVEPGESGQICVGGKGVTKGYVNDPEQTASRFVDDPFANESDARMYLTGDLGRFLPDGNIEFLGRSDFQVQVRGFRVEPAEIETAMLDMAGMAEACVIGVEYDGETVLVGFYTAKKDIDTKDVVTHLKGKTAQYMIPSKLLELEKIPLNVNGKFDRDKLTSMALEALGRDAIEVDKDKDTEPQDTETRLLSLACELLNCKLNLEDNFIDRGGNSLKVMRFISCIKLDFGVTLKVREFYECKDMGEVLERIEASIPQDKQKTEETKAEAKLSDCLEASEAQKHMYLLEMMCPDCGVCNIPNIFVLEGDVDPELLQKTLDIIVGRFEALRSSFSVEDNLFYRYDDKYVLNYEYLDISKEQDKEARLNEILEELGRISFDLQQGPLYKFQLFKIDEQLYKLVLVIHHIISDGFSIGVLEEAITDIYASLAENGEYSAAAACGYSFFIKKQADWLKTEQAQKQMSYWLSHLKDAKKRLNLKNTLPRPVENEFKGTTYQTTVPDELYSRIKELTCGGERSLFMISMSAYASLLYQYSGQKSIVIGTPMANRNNTPCCDEIVGLVMNSVALHFRIDEDMSFNELLAQASESAFAAFENQNIPFELVLEKIIDKREDGVHPVYQHMLILQNAHIAEREFAGIKLTYDSFDNHISKLDLTVHINELAEGLMVSFEYDTALFTGEAVEMMAENFIDLLDLLTVDPERKLGDIPMFESSSADKTSGQAEYQRVDKNFIPLVEMFCSQVEEDPDATALTDDNISLTYGQLDHVTNIIAQQLSAAGVEDRYVGINCERGLDFVVCALSVFKAGGGYITLDNDYPPQRLDFMIEDASVAAVLKPRHIESSINANTNIIEVDVKELLEELPADFEPAAITADSKAYAIYTSGSTGRPKGVEITHGNLMHLVNWQLEYYDIGCCDRSSHLARPSFDTSVSEIWPYLAAGACVAIPSDETMLDPGSLVKWICDNGITICDMTTPLAEIAIYEDWPQDTSLRVLKTGGDRLHKRPPKELPFKFINEYGPTECTVITTAGLIESDDNDEKPPHIGKPIDGASVYILDEQMRHVPQGSSGEIYIGGNGVAKGYINRKDLTQEKFLPDIFSGDPHAKMYKSGDMGSFLPDGNIEFIGRADFQIQLRGFRVELGEIEHAIVASGKVREAAVVATGHGSSLSIKAYIVADTPDGQIPSGLVAYLKQHLPDYMLPSSFMLLGQLPLTPNGKIDRRALSYLDDHEQSDGESDKLKAQPRNHIEQVLLDIWKELLGKEDIGIYDDFFDIGGHSLLIIRMAGMLEKHGFKLRVTKIFEYPKIANLASYLKFGDSSSADNKHEELVVLKKGEGGRLPLFFIHTVEGDMLFYSNLISCMDKKQPCYGILDKGIFDPSKKLRTVEQMAEHYVKMITKLQPEGPYMLVGYCFAGFIAFEIAKRLKETGRKVALLGLIETPVVNVPLKVVPYHLNRALNIIRFLPIKIKEMLNRQSRFIDPYEIDEGFIFDVWEGVTGDNKWLDNIRKTHKINMQSTDKYMFTPYDGDIVLYTASKRKMWRSRGKDLGWASLTRKVDIVEVDSLHKDISMPPYIETIADDIKERISDITEGKQH